MNNMRKFALLKDNIVVEIKNLSEVEVNSISHQYQLVIDIHDLLIEPSIGWVLVGNTLYPNESEQLPLNLVINSKIKFYQESASELLRELYVANTLAGITVQQSDQMFEDFSDVLLRIREGAWPTALYRLSQKSPNEHITQEVLDNWYQTILNRMI
jgi:hypothetical protein